MGTLSWFGAMLILSDDYLLRQSHSTWATENEYLTDDRNRIIIPLSKEVQLLLVGFLIQKSLFAGSN
jgi:hypothetical protein